MLSISLVTVLLLDGGTTGGNTVVGAAVDVGAVGVVELIGISEAGVVGGGPKEELDINVMLFNVVFSSSQLGNVIFSGIIMIGHSVVSTSAPVMFREGGRIVLLLPLTD